MQNLAALLGVIILALGYTLWRKSKKAKKLLQKNNELTQAKNVSTEVERLLLILNDALIKVDARSEVAKLIAEKDSLGEATVLGLVGESAWKIVEPIHKKAYRLLFETDFAALKLDAPFAALIAFDTRWINIGNCVTYIPGFKEKCLGILEKAIKGADTYEALDLLHKQATSWKPFELWQNEVELLFQKKAAIFTQRDLDTNRSALLKCFQDTGWSAQKATTLETLFVEGLGLLKRKLISEEMRSNFKSNKLYHSNFERVKTIFGEKSHHSGIPQKLVELGDMYDEVYAEGELVA